MARGSNRRIGSAKEHRHRDPGRLSERICGASRSRCASLRNQQTDTSATHQEHHPGDPGEPLSAARAARYLRKQEAWDRRKRRGSKVVLDSIDLRSIPQELDSSTLADLSFDGGQAVEVEKWLKGLCFPKTAVPLARGTKAKIRNIMSALFSHAVRWEWRTRSNSQCSAEREAAKCTRHPQPGRNHGNSRQVARTLRTAIELDAFTGLRRGELIGLQWQDIDFADLVIHVRRSVVQMVGGSTKTEASTKTCRWIWNWPSRCCASGKSVIYNRRPTGFSQATR